MQLPLLQLKGVRGYVVTTQHGEFVSYTYVLGNSGGLGIVERQSQENLVTELLSPVEAYQGSATMYRLYVLYNQTSWDLNTKSDEIDISYSLYNAVRLQGSLSTFLCFETQRGLEPKDRIYVINPIIWLRSHGDVIMS